MRLADTRKPPREEAAESGGRQSSGKDGTSAIVAAAAEALGSKALDTRGIGLRTSARRTLNDLARGTSIPTQEIRFR